MRGLRRGDLALVLACRAVLAVGDQVCDGNKIIAVRAWATRAEVPGLALRAFVDGVDLGGLVGRGAAWRRRQAAWRQASEHHRRRPVGVKPVPHCSHTLVAVVSVS